MPQNGASDHSFQCLIAYRMLYSILNKDKKKYHPTTLDSVKLIWVDWERIYCLLLTFANSLDPDQDRQNVGPDLDLNSLTL